MNSLLPLDKVVDRLCRTICSLLLGLAAGLPSVNFLQQGLMVNAFASASVMSVQSLASRLQISLLDNLQDAFVRGNQIPDVTGYILICILYGQEHSSI